MSMKWWETIKDKFAVHLKELELEHPAGLILFTVTYFNYDLQLHRNSDPLEEK